MVEKVEIYLEASSRYQAAHSRKACYLLEAEIDGVPYTRHGILESDATYHAAMLNALKAATARLKKPVDVCVHTEDTYIVSRLKELNLLRCSGYRNRDGTMIAYADEWKDIADHMRNVDVKAGPHSYSEWMQRQMEGENV